MTSLVHRLAASTYVRYGLGSLVALGGDMALFMTMLHLGSAPVAASSAGYALGIALQWLMSSRFIFAADTAPPGPARRRQLGLFLGSALAGFVVTTVVVGLGSVVGLSPLIAKLVAIALSFQATYMLRKGLVLA